MDFLSCSSCGLHKPRLEFSRRKEANSRRGAASSCKSCINHAARSRKRTRGKKLDPRVQEPGKVINKRIGLPLGFRPCTRCGLSFPENENNFTRKKSGYFSSWCKPCTRIYAKERMRERRGNPIDRIAVDAARRKHKMTDKGIAGKRAQSAIHNSIRRQRHLNIPIQWNINLWKMSQEYWGGKCAYCAQVRALTQDHFIPICSKDFPGTVPGNIVPACQPCNSKKHNKNPHTWIKNIEVLESILLYLRIASGWKTQEFS